MRRKNHKVEAVSPFEFFDLFRRHPVIPANAGIQLKINNPRSGQNLIVRLRWNYLTGWMAVPRNSAFGLVFQRSLE
jgi:hypothetical protein